MSESESLSRPPKAAHHFRRVAILFAGGPAPGANAVISTAATSFMRSGTEVIGMLRNGGLAEYEVATILGRQVWEAKYEPVDPTQFSGMKFDPTNYIGEFQWINNRTFGGDNDRGNLGYYLADIRAAAKPIFPEL